MLKLLESENITFHCPYCFSKNAKSETFEHTHITDVVITQITCCVCRCIIDQVFSPRSFGVNVKKGKLYEKFNFNDASIVSTSLS